MHDLRIALTIWGFFDARPPAELVALRRPMFEGVANSLHHYEERRGPRRLGPRGDAAPDPGPGLAAYRASWRELLGL